MKEPLIQLIVRKPYKIRAFIGFPPYRVYKVLAMVYCHKKV